MLVETQDYNIKMTYKPVSKITVAVALSRMPLNDTEEIRFIEVEHQGNLPLLEENFNSIKEKQQMIRR